MAPGEAMEREEARDAWAELRAEYAALHIRFDIPRCQQERLAPAWGEAVIRTDADLIAQCAANSTLPPPACAPLSKTYVGGPNGGD